DRIFLVPEQSSLNVHVLEAERVLRANQGWQRADFHVEIPFDKLGITLRKGSVDVFYCVRAREERHSDSRQVVGTTLQIELPPARGLLDKELGIADVIVRRGVAGGMVSFGPAHARENACNR